MRDPIVVECDECGEEFMTTFKPREGKPTFCKKCYLILSKSGTLE